MNRTLSTPRTISSKVRVVSAISPSAVQESVHALNVISEPRIGPTQEFMAGMLGVRRPTVT